MFLTFFCLPLSCIVSRHGHFTVFSECSLFRGHPKYRGQHMGDFLNEPSWIPLQRKILKNRLPKVNRIMVQSIFLSNFNYHRLPCTFQIELLNFHIPSYFMVMKCLREWMIFIRLKNQFFLNCILHKNVVIFLTFL